MTSSLALALALAASAAAPAPAPAPARPAAAPHAPVAAPPRAEAPATSQASRGLGGPGNVAASKHNLSTSGPGRFRATTESRVCVFCHVPHNGGGNAMNRPESTASYVPYTSSTLQSSVGALTRASRNCLSCHDGTIALGQTLTGRISMQGDDRLLPGAASLIGTDLRRSHPVSVKPGTSTQLKRPAPEDPVHLNSRTGEVECTSCHDPHRENGDPVVGKFLVKSNRQSELCLSCHEKTGWRAGPASHAVSTKSAAAVQPGGSPYGTVADDGCLSCHRDHGAPATGRLLRTAEGAPDEALCLRCHNGSVGTLDIQSEIRKQFSHATRGTHDAAEGRPGSAQPLPETTPGAVRHVTCVDCHNPHAAYALARPAPFASGPLAEVSGVDRSGARREAAAYQYEVCFKCHADSANQPLPTIQRRVPNANLRLALDTSAVSFHPVTGPGKGTDVPSLKAPLGVSSVILCTDCHGSDRDGAPRGPHGSTNPKLLKRAYSTIDNTTESAAAYALCYGCHDRAILLSDRSSFDMHQRHVVQANAPCSACHNSHGVPAQNGTAVANAHLIDFDVNIARAMNGVGPQYVSEGFRRGNCTLLCHGKDHDRRNYSGSGGVAAALRQRTEGIHRSSAAPAMGGAHRAQPAPKR